MAGAATKRHSGRHGRECRCSINPPLCGPGDGFWIVGKWRSRARAYQKRSVCSTRMSAIGRAAAMLAGLTQPRSTRSFAPVRAEARA